MRCRFGWCRSGWKTVIDRCIHQIYQRYFEDPVPEKMPLLEDLYNELLKHDEAVIEAPIDASLDEACQIMSIAPDWTPGLILNAAGYECEFYQKD